MAAFDSSNLMYVTKQYETDIRNKAKKIYADDEVRLTIENVEKQLNDILLEMNDKLDFISSEIVKADQYHEGVHTSIDDIKVDPSELIDDGIENTQSHPSVMAFKSDRTQAKFNSFDFFNTQFGKTNLKDLIELRPSDEVSTDSKVPTFIIKHNTQEYIKIIEFAFTYKQFPNLVTIFDGNISKEPTVTITRIFKGRFFVIWGDPYNKPGEFIVKAIIENADNTGNIIDRKIIDVNALDSGKDLSVILDDGPQFDLFFTTSGENINISIGKIIPYRWLIKRNYIDTDTGDKKENFQLVESLNNQNEETESGCNYSEMYYSKNLNVYFIVSRVNKKLGYIPAGETFDKVVYFSTTTNLKFTSGTEISNFWVKDVGNYTFIRVNDKTYLGISDISAVKELSEKVDKVWLLSSGEIITLYNSRLYYFDSENGELTSVGFVSMNSESGFSSDTDIVEINKSMVVVFTTTKNGLSYRVKKIDSTTGLYKDDNFVFGLVDIDNFPINKFEGLTIESSTINAIYGSYGATVLVNHNAVGGSIISTIIYLDDMYTLGTTAMFKTANILERYNYLDNTYEEFVGDVISEIVDTPIFMFAISNDGKLFVIDEQRISDAVSFEEVQDSEGNTLGYSDKNSILYMNPEDGEEELYLTDKAYLSNVLKVLNTPNGVEIIDKKGVYLLSPEKNLSCAFFTDNADIINTIQNANADETYGLIITDVDNHGEKCNFYKDDYTLKNISTKQLKYHYLDLFNGDYEKFVDANTEYKENLPIVEFDCLLYVSLVDHLSSIYNTDQTVTTQLDTDNFKYGDVIDFVSKSFTRVNSTSGESENKTEIFKPVKFVLAPNKYGFKNYKNIISLNTKSSRISDINEIKRFVIFNKKGNSLTFKQIEDKLIKLLSNSYDSIIGENNTTTHIEYKQNKESRISKINSIEYSRYTFAIDTGAGYVAKFNKTQLGGSNIYEVENTPYGLFLVNTAGTVYFVKHSDLRLADGILTNSVPVINVTEVATLSAIAEETITTNSQDVSIKKLSVVCIDDLIYLSTGSEVVVYKCLDSITKQFSYPFEDSTKVTKLVGITVDKLYVFTKSVFGYGKINGLIRFDAIDLSFTKLDITAINDEKIYNIIGTDDTILHIFSESGYGTYNVATNLYHSEKAFNYTPNKIIYTNYDFTEDLKFVKSYELNTDNTEFVRLFKYDKETKKFDLSITKGDIADATGASDYELFYRNGEVFGVAISTFSQEIPTFFKYNLNSSTFESKKFSYSYLKAYHNTGLSCIFTENKIYLYTNNGLYFIGMEDEYNTDYTRSHDDIIPSGVENIKVNGTKAFGNKGNELITYDINSGDETVIDDLSSKNLSVDTYTVTSDTSPDENKSYFELDIDNTVFSPIFGNIDNNIDEDHLPLGRKYVFTRREYGNTYVRVNTEKQTPLYGVTYYTRSLDGNYNPVTNLPKFNNNTQYYEKLHVFEPHELKNIGNNWDSDLQLYFAADFVFKSAEFDVEDATIKFKENAYYYEKSSESITASSINAIKSTFKDSFKITTEATISDGSKKYLDFVIPINTEVVDSYDNVHKAIYEVIDYIRTKDFETFVVFYSYLTKSYIFGRCSDDFKIIYNEYDNNTSKIEFVLIETENGVFVSNKTLGKTYKLDEDHFSLEELTNYGMKHLVYSEYGIYGVRNHYNNLGVDKYNSENNTFEPFFDNEVQFTITDIIEFIDENGNVKTYIIGTEYNKNTIYLLYKGNVTKVRIASVLLGIGFGNSRFYYLGNEQIAIVFQTRENTNYYDYIWNLKNNSLTKIIFGLDLIIPENTEKEIVSINDVLYYANYSHIHRIINSIDYETLHLTEKSDLDLTHIQLIDSVNKKLPIKDKFGNLYFVNAKADENTGLPNYNEPYYAYDSDGVTPIGNIVFDQVVYYKDKIFGLSGSNVYVNNILSDSNDFVLIFSDNVGIGQELYVSEKYGLFYFSLNSVYRYTESGFVLTNEFSDSLTNIYGLCVYEDPIVTIIKTNDNSYYYYNSNTQKFIYFLGPTEDVSCIKSTSLGTFIGLKTNLLRITNNIDGTIEVYDVDTNLVTTSRDTKETITVQNVKDIAEDPISGIVIIEFVNNTFMVFEKLDEVGYKPCYYNSINTDLANIRALADIKFDIFNDKLIAYENDRTKEFKLYEISINKTTGYNGYYNATITQKLTKEVNGKSGYSVNIYDNNIYLADLRNENFEIEKYDTNYQVVKEYVDSNYYWYELFNNKTEVYPKILEHNTLMYIIIDGTGSSLFMFGFDWNQITKTVVNSTAKVGFDFTFIINNSEKFNNTDESMDNSLTDKLNIKVTGVYDKTSSENISNLKVYLIRNQRYKDVKEDVKTRIPTLASMYKELYNNFDRNNLFNSRFENISSKSSDTIELKAKENYSSKEFNDLFKEILNITSSLNENYKLEINVYPSPVINIESLKERVFMNTQKVEGITDATRDSILPYYPHNQISL